MCRGLRTIDLKVAVGGRGKPQMEELYERPGMVHHFLTRAQAAQAGQLA